jgi:hypothetical protein
MRKLYTAILFFLFVSTSSLAQYWTSLNGPFGGTINDVVVPSGSVMLVSTTNGVFRSADSGATWTRMTLGSDILINDLEVDPNSSGNKIYATTSQGIRFYQSTDAGLTWSVFATNANGLSGFVNKIRVAPNGTIYVTDINSRFYKSTTAGGSTFSLINTFVNSINDLDVDASNNVYVSTAGQGIQVYNGTGFNANSTGSLTGSSVVLSTVISGTTIFALDASGPHKATTPGAAYATIKTASLTDLSYSGVIDVDPSGNVYLANNSTSKFWTTTAASAATATPTWTLGVAYPASYTVTATNFQSASTWFAGFGAAGLFKTTNAGTSWASSSVGIKALPATNHLFMTPVNNTFLMTFGGGLGYFVKGYSGTTWTLVSSASNTNRNLSGFVKLADNTILGYGNGVIRSVNEAASWSLQSAQVLTELVTPDGTNLYSYSGSSLLKSVNQGVTWTPTAITGFGATPSKIQVDGSNKTYFKAGSEIDVVASGGTTATKLNALTAITIQDFSVVANNIYVLGNSNTLFISTDGGASFIAKSTPAGATALYVYDSKNMALKTTANNLYISGDGGGIWTNQTLLDATAIPNDVLIGPDTYVYVATSNSTVHRSSNVVLLPGAPTNMTVIGTGYNQVQLLWNDNAINESDHVVEISVGDNLHYAALLTSPLFGNFDGTQPKINLSYTGLNKNTTYFFRVKAINAAGSSAYSNEVSATTLDQCVTTIPNNRSWTATTTADPGSTAAPGAHTSAVVNIQAVANTTNQFTISAYDLGADPSTTHPSGTFYESCGQTLFAEGNDMASGNGSWNGTTLVIKWQNAVFNSFFQATTTLTLNPTDPLPAQPTLSTYLYSGTEVLLNWNKVQFAQQYDLKRATVSGGPYTLVTTLNFPTVTYIDKGLTTGTNYYYIIVAKNSAGPSTASPEVGIQVQTGLFRPVENDIQLNFENQQGISWGDLDGDGDEDIAAPSFVNNAGLTVPPVFYENMGNGKDFTRRDLTALQTENTAVSRGINIFDFDNDGKLDLYISRSGTNIADILLINNGAWSFTKKLVSETIPFANGFRSSAAADYDNDGRVDVFVGNDNGSSPAIRDQLLRNAGVSVFSEILTGGLVTDLGNTRNASWADYDSDGDQDILVLDASTGATRPNRLYKNNGDGTFTLQTGLVFDTDLFLNSRTSSWGDIDNDGDLDLYIGAQTGGSIADRLYRNNGNGTFTSLSQPTSITETGTATFGSSFGDIDNDGDLDLIAINTAANSIFLNDGTGVFTKYAGAEMINHPSIAETGGAMVDFDQDGFLDIYPPKGQTNAVDLPNFLYKNSATPSASKNWLEIKLIGVQSNKAGIGTRITVTTASPARTQIREVTTRSGYGSQSSLIAHFGLGTATAVASIQIKWPSGIIQTVTNLSVVNRVFTITEDNTPPTVVTLNPANAAIGVAYNTKLEITFDEKPFPVSTKKLKLFDGATLVETFDATVGTVVGNKVSFTPTNLLGSTKTYTLSLDAGAFTDIYGNATAAIVQANWSFRSLDNTPPVITFTPPVTSIVQGTAAPIAFKPSVTDNAGPVATFTMSYRNVENKPFTDIVLSNVTGQQTFNVPAFGNMGINYYFTAKDADNNTTRMPPGAGTYLTARVQFSGTSLAAMSLVKGTGSASDYQIVSMPWDLPNKDMASNFSELSGGSTKFRFIRYHALPTPGWDEYPGSITTFARGEGYFINVTDVDNITFTDGFTPKENRDSLFVMSLKKGWNQIGNPYTTPIQWSDVLAYNNISAGLSQKLLIFSGGYQTSSDPNGVIQPNRGAFVLADNDINGLKIPFQGQTSGGRMMTTFTTDISQPNWELEFVLKQGKEQFRVASIGMAPEAKASIDSYDLAMPPRIGNDFIEMGVSHPEHFTHQFARDVVPTQIEYQWKYNILASSSGIAELHWDNTAFGDNGKDLFLLDEKLQQRINMRETSTYRFDPLQSDVIMIYYGENLEKKLKPSQVVLTAAYPNPTAGVAHIGFTLPDQPDTYQVQLDVFDLTGKRVATLLQNSLMAGFYAIEWDATDGSINNGLYTVRLIAAGKMTEEIRTQKIILSK